MKIRRKALAIVVFATVLLMLVLFSVSQGILLESYAKLEEDAVKTNLGRAVHAIRNEISAVKSAVSDYSAWNDTYEFIVSKSQDYINANMMDDTFYGLNVNLFMFVNSTGYIVFAKSYDLVNQTDTPVSLSLLTQIRENGLMWSFANPSSFVAGVIVFDQRAMLVASQPILTSENQGPIRGAVIVGRYLDASEIEALSQSIELPLAVYPSDSIMPPDCEAAKSSLSVNSTLVRPLSGETVAGYTLLADVYGKPGVLVRIEMPRTIYAEGQKTLQYFLAVSLLGSILFGGIIMGVLQTQVLDPVTRLSKDLQDIPRSTTRRVSVVGSDELTDLARVINEMLGKVEETSDRYRRLFQSSPISLWEEDFSGVKKYLDELRGRGIRDFRTYFIEHPEDVSKCSGLVKTLDVNQATLTLYKAKNVSEFVNGLSKVLTKESLDNFREELLALAEGKIKFESEFINQTLAGDVKHISVIMSVIPGYEDTLAKILVSIIDLTERKLMEERLLKAERMATIGETAAMVAHDLRNPLQGITSAVYVLKNNSLTADQENEMFQIIGSSVEYAEAIVRDLMDYSREIHLARAESQPREIIQSALEAVKVPSNVEVRDLSQEQPAISVDPDRMKRVFINLIENAVDATPQGGTLTIQTTELNGHMEIKVSDTGTGMPKKIMENLWIPMQTTKSKGMGLGLPIVKRIIDAHSGEITVNSRQGEGTTFIIRLPIKATT